MGKFFRCEQESGVVVADRTRNADASAATPDSVKNLAENSPIIRGLPSLDTFGIVRDGVAHKLTIAGRDFSHILISVSVQERVSKDTKYKLALDNTSFQYTNAAELAAGAAVQLSLYDGVDWRDFDTMWVLDPTRSYAMGGKITLNCGTRKFKLTVNEKPQTWQNKRDSEIVADIARKAGFRTDIQETKIVHREVAQGKESAATLINRLAVRNGYTWGVKGHLLFFRKLKPDTTPITLHYRPGNGAIGEIIEATAQKQTNTKKGKKSTATTGAADFSSGTVDPNTIDDTVTNNNSLANQDTPSPVTRPRTADEVGEALEDDTAYEFGEINEARDGGWEDVKPAAGVDGGGSTARNAEEANVKADAINANNAFEYVLHLSTYGMADIQLERVIDVRGLGESDTGKWLVTAVTTNYSAGSAYRLKVETKAHVKPTASGDGVGVGAGGKVGVKQEADAEAVVYEFGEINKQRAGGWKLRAPVGEKVAGTAG